MWARLKYIANYTILFFSMNCRCNSFFKKKNPHHRLLRPADLWSCSYPNNGNSFTMFSVAKVESVNHCKIFHIYEQWASTLKSQNMFSQFLSDVSGVNGCILNEYFSLAVLVFSDILVHLCQLLHTTTLAMNRWSVSWVIHSRPLVRDSFSWIQAKFTVPADAVVSLPRTRKGRQSLHRPIPPPLPDLPPLFSIHFSPIQFTLFSLSLSIVLNPSCATITKRKGRVLFGVVANPIVSIRIPHMCWGRKKLIELLNSFWKVFTQRIVHQGRKVKHFETDVHMRYFHRPAKRPESLP